MTATAPARTAGRTILVLANHPDTSTSTTAHLLTRARGYRHALIVAPATPPAKARWIVADDEAERQARARAGVVAGVLRAGGLDTRIEVGDADPQRALADARALHPVDGTVVLGTERAPRRRRHLRRRHLVAAA